MARLVQRLGKGLGYINPFGEAKAVEGLSEDVLTAISNTFEIQYMGAAEYEWGAFGKAMAKLWEYELEIVPVNPGDEEQVIIGEAYLVCSTGLTYAGHASRENGDIPVRDFARRCIKNIYLGSFNDFGAEGKRISLSGHKRTEVSRDDWGTFYDALHKVDKSDTYGNEGTIGWLDLGYEENDTYAWFLSLEDAEKFEGLVKNPVSV